VAEVEKVVSGFAFADGPVFSRLGFLLFTDPPRNRIYRYIAGRPLEVFRENSNGAGGISFDRQGRLLLCERDRVTRREKDGTITVLAEKVAPNDVVHSIDGSSYFTAESGVYQITRQGRVRLVVSDPVKPNGIALSANQQILYVASTVGSRMRRYLVAPDGSLVRGSTLPKTAHFGPDGLKTDEQGNLYVAAQRRVGVRLLGPPRADDRHAGGAEQRRLGRRLPDALHHGADLGISGARGPYRRPDLLSYKYVNFCN
jgi:gluconolactonase